MRDANPRCPQPELQREAGVRVGQLAAVQLAELSQPVAHGLWMDVQVVRAAANVALLGEPGEQGLRQRVARTAAEGIERRERPPGELGRQGLVLVQEDRLEVRLGANQTLVPYRAGLDQLERPARPLPAPLKLARGDGRADGRTLPLQRRDQLSRAARRLGIRDQYAADAR